MNESPILWEETIQPGATWSHVLKRGTALRVVDVEGGANVGGIFYNFECPVERYNLPDTLKAQHIARLTTGFVLYSDMGRILCSVMADTVGWHDPIGGTSNKQLVEKKYGPSTYRGTRGRRRTPQRPAFELAVDGARSAPAEDLPHCFELSLVRSWDLSRKARPGTR